MNIKHLGPAPTEVKHTSDLELPERARLYMIRSGEIPDDQRDSMRAIGAEFLHELVGERSFRMRFGTQKPSTERLRRLVDHFLDGSEHTHTILLLMRHQRLLGACSIYDHPLRDIPSGEIIDGSRVVEFSVTIADEYQGQGLGKLLLDQARQHAIATGHTHAYCSFEAGNEPSRRMVRSVLGGDSIVAGSTNPRDKYYRLVTESAEFAQIEQAMQVYCGDREPQVVAPVSPERIVYVPATFARSRFGRRVIEAADIMLPDTVHLLIDE